MLMVLDCTLSNPGVVSLPNLMVVDVNSGLAQLFVSSLIVAATCGRERNFAVCCSLASAD